MIRYPSLGGGTMNPLIKSAIMGALGFVLFFLVWISLLVENFATPHHAVSLDIYRNELVHNPLFWAFALASALVFGSVSHLALSSHRELGKHQRMSTSHGVSPLRNGIPHSSTKAV